MEGITFDQPGAKSPVGMSVFDSVTNGYMSTVAETAYTDFHKNVCGTLSYPHMLGTRGVFPNKYNRGVAQRSWAGIGEAHTKLITVRRSAYKPDFCLAHRGSLWLSRVKLVR